MLDSSNISYAQKRAFFLDILHKQPSVLSKILQAESAASVKGPDYVADVFVATGRTPFTITDVVVRKAITSDARKHFQKATSYTDCALKFLENLISRYSFKSRWTSWLGSSPDMELMRSDSAGRSIVPAIASELLSCQGRSDMARWSVNLLLALPIIYANDGLPEKGFGGPASVIVHLRGDDYHEQSAWAGTIILSHSDIVFIREMVNAMPAPGESAEAFATRMGKAFDAVTWFEAEPVRAARRRATEDELNLALEAKPDAIIADRMAVIKGEEPSVPTETPSEDEYEPCASEGDEGRETKSQSPLPEDVGNLILEAGNASFCFGKFGRIEIAAGGGGSAGGHAFPESELPTPVTYNAGGIDLLDALSGSDARVVGAISQIHRDGEDPLSPGMFLDVVREHKGTSHEAFVRVLEMIKHEPAIRESLKAAIQKAEAA